MLWMWLIIYLIVGMIEDFLGTMTLRMVVKERIWLSTIFTFFINVIGMVVFYSIFVRLTNETEEGIISILVYSIGIAMGTFIAMKVKIKKGGEK